MGGLKQPARMTEALESRIAEALKAMPHGWASVEKGVAMARQVLLMHARVVVEIGVYAGRSLIPQALALKHQGFGTIYGIDPWATHWAVEGQLNPADADWWRKVDLEQIHQSCMAAIRTNGVEECVTILRCPSHACWYLFKFLGIDLLYIDGCHSEEASTRDVALYLPMVRSGGQVWFDDSSWATTQKAIAAIRKRCVELGKVDDCLIFRRLHRHRQRIMPLRSRLTVGTAAKRENWRKITVAEREAEKELNEHTNP